MNNNQIPTILMYILIAMVVVLVCMLFVYIKISVKEHKRKKLEKKKKEEIKNKEKPSTNTPTVGNILDFMEFENVEDNMIIKKEKQKYLMVIECQGVNYDLMSQMEKVGVEEGFLQFLNTLRYPVQLYIQTRSINLDKSINTYKSYLKNIESNYIRKKMQYDQMLANGNISNEQKEKAFFELTKVQNLYEYGKDIINDTEKMSLNKNILNKKYYVIVAYNYESREEGLKYDKEEIRNMAFSDLYTKSQSIIRTLSACGVGGKILNSIELVELLYMAYNREGAESFGIKRALEASYDKLYSTAPDVFVKKVRVLDKYIEEKAVEEAQQELKTAKQDIEKELRRKEKEKEKLINDMAKIILQQNKKYIGKELSEKAIGNIEIKSKEKTAEKGGK